MARFAVLIPFYATGLRGDDLEGLLRETVGHAGRFGATRSAVYRSREDPYGFQVLLHFEDKSDWTRYWHSEEFVEMRTRGGSWFQKPLQYDMHDIVVDEVAPARAVGERGAA